MKIELYRIFIMKVKGQRNWIWCVCILKQYKLMLTFAKETIYL